MKIVDKLPYFIVAGFAWIAIVSSCANQGMPTGGPRDSIPPVLVSTQPEYKALNFSGEEVRLTFNEFIIPDAISEKLVVSPPLENRLSILTKSKTLIIRFNEELTDSATYSLDFKNSVVDNNERNELEGLRFSFSTGDVYDSLRVAGKIMNGFNLEPEEESLVMLHKNLHDSAVYTLRPNYIAKTDEEGKFLISNIAPGKYHLFSINDLNNDLRYNEGAEKIAFADTLIVPGAEFHAEADTLTQGLDSLLIEGHTHFSPDPVFMRNFTENIYEQYVKKAERESKYKSTFVFNETVIDTFGIRPIHKDTKDWFVLEPNEKFDSLTVWIADTTLAANDTIPVEMSYYQLDSLDQLYLQTDTVELIFTEKKEESKRGRRDRNEDDEEEEGPEPVPQFNWSTNLSSSNFELNNDILLTAPHPLAGIDTSAMLLYLSQDTLKTPLNFKFAKDTTAWRTYRIAHNWEPETSYTLEIDSAACINIYGITSKALESSFKTRAEDYYGSINLELNNVTGDVLVQLLENTDKEEVIREIKTHENGTVIFDFLAPDKYKVKVIYDRNSNGKWDPGSYQDKFQPELVSYINEVIKVRSNWEWKHDWNLTPDPTFIKNIRDKELEEQQRKEAEEKARRESEQGTNQRQQQNNMFGPGGGISPGSLRPTGR
jgi:hypothetical protein